jgi:hypothetical protein
MMHKTPSYLKSHANIYGIYTAKKQLLPLLKWAMGICLWVAYADCFAQNREQQFGLRLSTGLANFYESKPKRSYRPKGFSYELGISTHIVRKDRVGFIVELTYAQKNVEDASLGYSLNYFYFNCLPNAYFPKTKTTLFLGGGLGYLVFAKIINIPPKSYDPFNKPDAHLVVGLNNELLAFHAYKIVVDARFNWGLFNIIEDYNQLKTKNYGLSLGLLIKKTPRQSQK